MIRHIFNGEQQRTRRDHAERVRRSRNAETEIQRTRRLQQIAQHQRDRRAQQAANQRLNALPHLAHRNRQTTAPETAPTQLRTVPPAQLQMPRRAEPVNNQPINRRLLHFPARRSAFSVLPQQHYAGMMNRTCDKCHAKYFQQEVTSRNLYTKCCHGGAVILPALLPPSQTLVDLFTGETLIPFFQKTSLCSGSSYDKDRLRTPMCISAKLL